MVDRYELDFVDGRMVWDKEGEYVDYEDYAKLEQENKELLQKLQQLEVANDRPNTD
jgi:hypothetical protein